MMMGGLGEGICIEKKGKVKWFLLLFNIEIYWQINNKKLAKYCNILNRNYI